MAGNGSTRTLTRRTPIHEVDDLYESVRDLVESTLPGRFRRRLLGPAEPAIDMFERDGNVVVKAEMPGIPPENIDVSVSGNELRISGERSEEKEVKEQDYYHCERQVGRVFRSVLLPDGCDAEAVQATAKDGVIEVVIPRKAAASTRKIEVKAS
ncbi:MAG TPA: Hsp20/alpha crystallin family protein [Dehalococcoidia bacterium]|nr:Hsp20/alpha crystallin family protein [Dehalococcoidia bacterium]